MPILISYEAAAQLMGVNKLTVRRMVDAGKLPRVMIGAALPRIRVSDLEAFIESRVEIITPPSKEKPKRLVGRPRKNLAN